MINSPHNHFSMGGDASKYNILTNIHGKNLQFNGKNFLHSTNSAEWETWTFEKIDKDLYYISNDTHDVRLSANNDCKTVYASKNRAAWERWNLHFNGLGQFFIQSSHGCYLGQASDGGLYQTRNKGLAETWKIVKK